MMKTKKFYQQFDAITGKMEWKVVEEDDMDDEDMVIQLARSNFGDMIYDYDRNDKFSNGLKFFINHLKNHNKNNKIHVVDIGTGTGLLSMMAARHGADSITAVEVFNPMAIIAKKIIAKNGFADKINVIHSRSTEVDDRYLSKKGDVIVAEVFDTELIGEGALRTFKEGLPTFGKPKCRVVPCRGKVWICPVTSQEIQKFRKLPGNVFKPPFSDCHGISAVFDVQFSEFPSNWFTVLGEPLVAFNFNFEDAESIEYNESFIREFTAIDDGIFNTIIFWWDIDMDDSGDNIISTIPKQFSDKYVWRDHWIQAIYFLPEPVKVKKDDKVDIACTHDEYSLWFDIPNENEKNNSTVCSCQLHSILSRYQFYRMNILDENDTYLKIIEKICEQKTILTFSDCSLISLYGSRSAKKVLAVETGFASARMVQEYCKLNNIENIEVVHSVDKYKEQLNELDSLTILAEPFFSTSIMPWHDVLRYYNLILGVRNMFGNSNIEIYPNEAKLMCLPVKFEHLWKIAAPVGIVDEFDLTEFDDICQKARSVADPIVEQHLLFEYPSIVTGNPVEVYHFDFYQKIDEKTTLIEPILPNTNGIVFWVDYKFKFNEDEITMTNGLMKSSKIGEQPKWHPGYHQGVFFIPKKDIEAIKSIQITLKPGDLDIDFEFEINH